MRAKDDENGLPPSVADELDLLGRVRGHLLGSGTDGRADRDYDEELIQLRDAIGEARPEDVPPLVEQMTRLQALKSQRGAGEDVPLDPDSPYFGHLRLVEDEGARDVLLGKHTYLRPEEGIRIVDWRNAPVSRMYYVYDEGDDYEEEFGGRTRRGRVAARRSVTIENGALRRVASQQGIHTLKDGAWIRLEGGGSRLAGGQGSSVRAGGLRPLRGRLGVDADGVERRDKHLPEISALLDREQFELITDPVSDLIVVQGSAGSGKTTVGLHRIAFLAYQNPKRFRPRRMMVVTLNPALADYISGVLPALGVRGVRVVSLEHWAHQQRRRHVRGLPTRVSEWTPSVVSRLKKHPAMTSILAEIVERHDERLGEGLLDAVRGMPDARRVEAAWRGLGNGSLYRRRRRLERWLNGKAMIGGDRGRRLDRRTARAAAVVLSRTERGEDDVVSDWSDLLTDREALGEAFAFHAPGEFSEGQLDEVHRWCVAQHERLLETPVDEPDGVDGRTEREPPELDAEDDALLLRLHQLERGPLRGSGPGGRLTYEHLMVDEVQDMSPLEVAVLLDTVARGGPVTLAGDTAQRISRESGFDDWDTLLGDLGLDAARIEPLRIAYRSTAEVMRVAREILGPLAGEAPVARRHGAEVEVHRFTETGQAVDFLGAALRELAAREPLANVAVIARHPAQAADYHRGLRKAEVPRLELIVDQGFSFAPGVEVTDVRQVKGLEFDYVVLVEVNAGSYPDNEEARHLLHVGATRAAHQLWMITTSRPSPLIPPRLL
ncbi:MAG: 3'-5' exonuclease [Polyangia bacterium]